MAQLDRCPDCRRDLESRVAKHGHVQVCPDGHGGATTLALLKRVLPEAMTRALWLSARQDVVLSDKDCPTCTHPLSPTAVRGIDVCLNCQGVWVEAGALEAARLAEPESPAGQRAAQAIAIAQGEAVPPRLSDDLLAEVVVYYLLPALFD